MLAIDLVATMFLAAGAFFMIIGTAGLLRFPDFYTRLHATGKCDTLGQILIIVGCMTYEGLSFITIKLIFVSAFYLLVGPTGTHALMKAAYASGLDCTPDNGQIVKQWYLRQPPLRTEPEICN